MAMMCKIYTWHSYLSKIQVAKILGNLNMHQFVSSGEYKIQRMSKHSVNKMVREVINTLFNRILQSNYKLSNIYEFTNTNNVTLLLKIQAEQMSNMSDSSTNSIQRLV